MHTTYPDNPAPDFNSWSNYIDSLIKDRPAEFANGIETEYRGFVIKDDFTIYKNGKQIFKARWQECLSLEDAKTQIDMSIMAGEVLKNRPNLGKINIPDFCELENGSERREFEERQINNHFENELYER